MFFTIYKTTNICNGKFYIGKHKTNCIQDSYLGSGKLLNKAIKKYGKENFIKEILHVFDNSIDCNAKELELVNNGLLLDPLCYNLCIGGMGGNFVQRLGKNYDEIYGSDRADLIKDKISSSKQGDLNPFYGKTHSIEYKSWLSTNTNFKHISKQKRQQAINTRQQRAEAGIIQYGMQGKTHKESSKAKTSAKLTGKRWWHNSEGLRVRSIECPGEGFILGRGK